MEHHSAEKLCEQPISRMHFARLKNSPRLKRVLAVLESGGWLSTRQIMNRAQVCAVNSCISELRENGCRISCERKGNYWWYKLDTKMKTGD